MISVPEAFLDNPQVDTYLWDGVQGFVYKRVTQTSELNNRLLSTTAFTFVMRGALQVDDGNSIFHVEVGQFVVLPKGIYVITDLIPNDGAFEAWVAFPSDQVLRPCVDLVAGKGGKSVSIQKQPDQLSHFFQSVKNVYENQRVVRGEVAHLKMTELILLLLHHDKSGELNQHLAALMSKEKSAVKPFMELHFAKPLQVEDYALLSGRSLSSFYRAFKIEFGVGPKQWLIQKRMELAKELIQQDVSSVRDLAVRVGYKDLPHFSKMFKAYHGIAPVKMLKKTSAWV